MPTTVSGLTFYEEQFETGFYQGLTQKIAGFNESGAGCILLRDGAKKGRRPTETYFTQVNPVQARDPSGTGNLTPTQFANAERNTIKIFHAAPMTFTSQDWEDYGMSEETGSRLFGVSYGEQYAQTLLNTALSAVIGAIQAIGANAIHDVSGSSTFDYGVLNEGLGKMGDRRQALRTLFSYSKPLTDMFGQAFTSQQIAFQLGSTTIYNGSMASLGMNVVNTDAPPLFVDNTGTDHYWIPVLRPMAVEVMTGPTRRVFNLMTGSASATPENHTWLLSVESSIELKVQGASYTDAGDSPNDASLLTPANWTDNTNSNDPKNGPGVLIKVQ